MLLPLSDFVPIACCACRRFCWQHPPAGWQDCWRCAPLMAHPCWSPHRCTRTSAQCSERRCLFAEMDGQRCSFLWHLQPDAQPTTALSPCRASANLLLGGALEFYAAQASAGVSCLLGCLPSLPPQRHCTIALLQVPLLWRQLESAELAVPLNNLVASLLVRAQGCAARFDHCSLVVLRQRA